MTRRCSPWLLTVLHMMPTTLLSHHTAQPVMMLPTSMESNCKPISLITLSIQLWMLVTLQVTPLISLESSLSSTLRLLLTKLVCLFHKSLPNMEQVKMWASQEALLLLHLMFPWHHKGKKLTLLSLLLLLLKVKPAFMYQSVILFWMASSPQEMERFSGSSVRLKLVTSTMLHTLLL